MSVLLTASTPAPPVAVTAPPMRPMVLPILIAPPRASASMPSPLPEVTVEVVLMVIVPVLPAPMVEA